MTLKNIFWKATEKTLSHNKFKEIFNREFPRVQDPSTNKNLKLSALANASSIYPDLYENKDNTSKSPIFITARFRSGSTLLWNIFRHIDQLHSYYEPLNERMWFDKTHREDHTDKSHIGVQDYWEEYNHLKNISHFFSKKWTNKHLLMDQTSSDSTLHLYISSLIEQSPKRPVLQFNRVDFRLQWLKANFPEATIIHLYRHPRDQWISVSKYSNSIDLKLSGHDYTSYNLFYTMEWARDLASTFPFLNPALGKHPYYYHYLLWRLSYMYGKTYSSLSISFESLVSDPEQTLTKIVECLDLKNIDIEALKKYIFEQKIGKWSTYANDSWYQTIETKCDDILEKYFS